MTYSSTPQLSTTTVGKPTSCDLAFMNPAVNEGYYFAFARVKGEICLVQVSINTPLSALTTVDVKIFRHEFITIFRLSESTTLHPSDIYIIEAIDDRKTRYEEDSETVFLAKDLMDRMRKMSDPRRMVSQSFRYQMQTRKVRQR